MTRAEKILLLVEKENFDFHHPAVQMSKKIMVDNPDKKIKPHKHPHKKGNGI